MDTHKFQSLGVGLRYKQKPVSVMLPPELDNRIRALPNRSEFIRQAIAEKFAREDQEQLS
ncbi:hypothetical protein [Kamptonema formosum]|uniref:hypothetical protein n=1 Tax=Kamptonema formosum TaxID=331992 RepID=UPI00034B0507|nr:hypothetical protein [Oscillatoria sp. PCC 10802]